MKTQMKQNNDGAMPITSHLLELRKRLVIIFLTVLVFSFISFLFSEDLIKNLNPKIIGWKNYYSTKTNETWMQELDWYIICTFTRWYNKKHQRCKHMSRVGFVRNSIYEKGLKKMARA